MVSFTVKGMLFSTNSIYGLVSVCGNEKKQVKTGMQYHV